MHNKNPVDYPRDFFASGFYNIISAFNNIFIRDGITAYMADILFQAVFKGVIFFNGFFAEPCADCFTLPYIRKCIINDVCTRIADFFVDFNSFFCHNSRLPFFLLTLENKPEMPYNKFTA